WAKRTRYGMHELVRCRCEDPRRRRAADRLIAVEQDVTRAIASAAARWCIEASQKRPSRSSRLRVDGHWRVNEVEVECAVSAVRWARRIADWLGTHEVDELVPDDPR